MKLNRRWAKTKLDPRPKYTETSLPISTLEEYVNYKYSVNEFSAGMHAIYFVISRKLRVGVKFYQYRIHRDLAYERQLQFFIDSGKDPSRPLSLTAPIGASSPRIYERVDFEIAGIHYFGFLTEHLDCNEKEIARIESTFHLETLFKISFPHWHVVDVDKKNVGLNSNGVLCILDFGSVRRKTQQEM